MDSCVGSMESRRIFLGERRSVLIDGGTTRECARNFDCQGLTSNSKPLNHCFYGPERVCKGKCMNHAFALLVYIYDGGWCQRLD